MDLALDGKTAYVTGGAHGIGEASVRELLGEGVKVCVADIDKAALLTACSSWAGLVPGAQVTIVPADLSTASGVEGAAHAALQQLGAAPDLLVNNVGVATSAPFVDVSDEQWSRTFELNFMSYVRTSRVLLPLMARRSGSAVVNIASDLAKQPETMPIDYGSMKAAVLYLTKALSQQFAPAVRINAVLPGPVLTRLWTKPGGLIEDFMSVYGTSDREAALSAYLKDRQLTLGLSRPEDVAALVMFALSPRARQINGASLDIGGTSRSLF